MVLLVVVINDDGGDCGCYGSNGGNSDNDCCCIVARVCILPLIKLLFIFHFSRHLTMVKAHYGDQVIVNLLGSKEGEDMLSKSFQVKQFVSIK